MKPSREKRIKMARKYIQESQQCVGAECFA